MKSIWIAQVDGNEIRIENSWFNGEKLYINDMLQDQQVNVFGATLSGNLHGVAGAKNPIRANLGGFFKIKCYLFIDDKPIAVTQVK